MEANRAGLNGPRRSTYRVRRAHSAPCATLTAHRSLRRIAHRRWASIMLPMVFAAAQSLIAARRIA